MNKKEELEREIRDQITAADRGLKQNYNSERNAAWLITKSNYYIALSTLIAAPNVVFKGNDFDIFDEIDEENEYNPNDL